MRHIKILLLYCEHIYEYRSRIFVYFLISLFNPLLYLIFWRASHINQQVITSGWTITAMNSYYLLFVIAGGLLFVHVEEDAHEDIVEGHLSSYLVKPYSYFWLKFYSEFPWRIIQGGFGLIAFLLLLRILGVTVHISTDVSTLFFAFLITVFGYILMFLFKMQLLLSSLWFTDLSGINQFAEIIILIGAGFIMPIYLFPSWLISLIHYLPFPYMIYYPVLAIQGILSTADIQNILIAQIIWCVLLAASYRFLWVQGIKKFSGVGQ